ncbi:hypothetical protein Acr_22g0008440 [Actinidia rufa]|uniref:Bet v I/Major latex protein domain-containing protein n=1 Tax=Actinidia rufa TaxID=165716 RepID=A0A7J0GKW4_9ERIC|nr:hypothetical protein Acr_22g0008440 [Actinidia rufa]
MDVSTHELELQHSQGIMGVSTQYLEIPLLVPPSTMFKGLILDGRTLIPHLLPLVINKIEPVKDGTMVIFGEGCHYESVTLRTNATDEGQFANTCTIFEGDPALMDKFESITYHSKFVEFPSCPHGGSIYKCWTTFITKGDYRVTKMDIQNDIAYQTLTVKAIEAYHIAHSKH